MSPIEAEIMILLLPPLLPSLSRRALLLGARRRSVRLVVSPLSNCEVSEEDCRRRDLVRPSSLQRLLCHVNWFTLLSAIKCCSILKKKYVQKIYWEKKTRREQNEKELNRNVCIHPRPSPTPLPPKKKEKKSPVS